MPKEAVHVLELSVDEVAFLGLCVRRATPPTAWGQKQLKSTLKKLDKVRPKGK